MKVLIYLKLLELMLIVYKPEGWTPNQLIDYIKSTYLQYKDSKISFAGRLDPMARGLTILLIDDECKKQDTYIAKKKTYQSKLLLGVNTDTSDVLGIPTIIHQNGNLDNIEIETTIKSFIGKQNQDFPNYSAKYVKSKETGERKPLWKWTKENQLDKIEIPSKMIEIEDITIINTNYINSMELLEIIETKINKLMGGDFRQNEILEKWRQLLINNNQIWTIVELESLVSSGTYIRSLSHDIGSLLQIGGIALDINRTKIDNIENINLDLEIN